MPTCSYVVGQSTTGTQGVGDSGAAQPFHMADRLRRIRQILVAFMVGFRLVLGGVHITQKSPRNCGFFIVRATINRL